MANYAPLLLLGGAALLLAGGKKKKKEVRPWDYKPQIELPPTTPPPLPKEVKKAGSGYPGVSRAKMQKIQTMLIANGYDPGEPDGTYTSQTAQAVEEFQEDWGQGLAVDGKPGPKTQAALEAAEKARKGAIGIDECDPLKPSTWGAGNVCVFDGARWVRAKGEQKAAVATDNAPGTPAGKKCTIRAVEAAIAGGGGDPEKMQLLLSYDAECQGLFSDERRKVIQLALKS